jgi:cell division protein FtsB
MKMMILKIICHWKHTLVSVYTEYAKKNRNSICITTSERKERKKGINELMISQPVVAVCLTIFCLSLLSAAAAFCLSCIRSIKSVSMSSDNEYEIRELRKEIDYLAEDVEKLKRLVKNMKDVNSLKLTADDEEYLRGID